MAVPGEVESLRSLQRDLLDFSESRLANIDRLLFDLEAHVQAFRDLLEKPAKNEKNREALGKGTVEFNAFEYSLNADYQNEVLELSDALDLDELECARLLLGSEEEAIAIDRPRTTAAVIRFHDKRLCTLDSLRLLLQQHLDLNVEEVVRTAIHEFTLRVMDLKPGPADKETRYLQKCTLAMQNIEQWLARLADQAQRAVTLGSASEELVEYQQHSLNKQHESLAAIFVLLVKGNYSLVEDFHKLLDHVPKIDKWSGPAMHYVPMLLSLISEFAPPDGRATLREARLLHRKLAQEKESKPWLLPQFHAAAIAWWIAEYTGWYYDRPLTSPLQGVDLAAEAVEREQAFDQALRDGAFQFTLSVSTQVKSRDWQDPSQKRLTQLLNDMPMVPQELLTTQPYFRDLVMEHFGNFAEACITNMPDTLRRFKTEEDDQRRKLLSGFLNGHQNGIPESDFHLERFLVIMSYAYEDRPDAAQTFWEDQTSNFYGFLQWASKRQATPRVGAFCEMFKAISKGEENSLTAHNFLLEDNSASSGRLRRSAALSWAQILQEIKVYAYSSQDSASLGAKKSGVTKAVDIDEPESYIMLETYLRLAFHLCRQSEAIRTWMLNQQEQIPALDALFQLCNRGIPGSLRGCAFNLVEALLVGKSAALGNSVWTILDHWVYGSLGAMSSGSRPPRSVNFQGRAENVRFETIASNYDESNAFLGLLTALVNPAAECADLNDSLPFPEQLGGANRMAGIDPYVDFVLGNIFAIQAPQQYDLLCLRTLSFRSLEFAAICLDTFNEDLLVLANKSNISNMTVDESINTSSLSAYARLHPFCRVMEWIFNDKVINALFTITHQNIYEVMRSPHDSPLVLLLMVALDTMSSVMDLQATYTDIVSPLVQQESSASRKLVSNSSLASFEDAVVNHLGIIIDLGRYCASHEPLAVSSLNLLTKLAGSRKLNAIPKYLSGSNASGNKLNAALDESLETDAIMRKLVSTLDFDERELSQGSSSSAYQVKLAVLEFLDKTLTAFPERPNIAHTLLGFVCRGSAVYIGEDTLFSNGFSLFHKVLAFALEYPDVLDGSLVSWTLRLRQKANKVITTLWTSTLTSDLVLNELREVDFLVKHFLAQNLLDNATPWDGSLLEDPNNLLHEDGSAFEYYLCQRCSLLKHAAASIRHAIRIGLKSACDKTLATVLGTITLPSGEQTSSLSVLDLFDFMGLNDSYPLSRPQTSFFSNLDINVALICGFERGSPSYDMKLIAEQIGLITNNVRRMKEMKVDIDETPLLGEAQATLCYFQAVNNRTRIENAKIDTLQAWTDLIVLVINSGNLDAGDQSTFILRALQVIPSKLDIDASNTAAEALLVARLANTLLSNFDLDPKTLGSKKVSDVAYNRLFQLFRTSTRAISSADRDGLFREMLYSICTKYLAKTAGLFETSQRRSQRFQTIKGAGETFIETLCDDAYGGEGSCGTAALLLLDAIASCVQEENPTFMLGHLSHINFIVNMVDSIQDIPDELLEDNGKDTATLITYYQAKLSLLLTISFTRPGATALVTAGFFSAVRESRLFAGDPDLGFDVDNPDALHQYHILLLYMAKILTSIVLSQGPQNQQTLEQARAFLVENRASVVSILKRRAKLGSSRFQEELDEEVLEELVECYILLISCTDFLEYEERANPVQLRRSRFS